MTDEVKTEEAVEAVEAPEVQKVESPEEKANRENIELQGKKAHTKKKINHLSNREILSEIQRLEKAGHEHSSYYSHLKKQARAQASIV
jgi:hypothetical protein